MKKGFDTRKYDEAVKRQQIREKDPDKPDVTVDILWFMCWDCDKSGEPGEYFLPRTHGRTIRICPRHVGHRDIEYMGRGRAAIKWDHVKETDT